jgi:excinuclease UvrABC nuclease subunit
MDDLAGDAYMFTFEAVRRKAPRASGVYTIYTAQRWVYVGESDDIQKSLFQHLNEPDACINRFGQLSFSFELTPTDERQARQHALIAELEPACISALA